MSTPTIVFDLDGTLVDTAPDLIDTLNTTLARFDIGALVFNEARAMIGHGVRPMLERALQAKGRMLADSEIDTIFADYLESYRARIADRSLPFPGVEATLQNLKANDYRLAVCTNKPEGLSARLLEQLGLSGYFAAICGPDTFGMKKPDPRVLHLTIARAGGKSERSVLVGDSLTDIETARAAGIPIIAVDFGYSPDPIATFRPDRIISHFDGFRAIADDLLGI